MQVEGEHYRTIWFDDASHSLKIIDQTQLPHDFETVSLRTLEEVATAICSMQVRGAPLIGATAAWGMAIAVERDASPDAEEAAARTLLATRPTAVNLRWAVERVRAAIADVEEGKRAQRAHQTARQICDEDARTCEAIGSSGQKLLEEALDRKNAKGEPLQILTHCNAGWLATVDWGTALAPVYKAHEAGIPLHVWVDETRPRNQGASLTAWELGQAGIPHTLITDNTGGHLMQHRQVDLCIVGSDRTTARGDVCNKIGTYLKALAAKDNAVPFYVALPVSTIDWGLRDGIREIPIEERDASEVLQISGLSPDGERVSIRIAPDSTRAANYGFDVTPARLVSALVTEHGVFAPSDEDLARLRTAARL